MRYVEFLAKFPEVKTLNATKRVTLFRWLNQGRVIAVRDRLTGDLRFVSARLRVGDLM